MKDQKIQIFIADDDPFFTSVLKGLIEEIIPNAKISTFENVHDCMSKIFHNPDLIFLDYNFNNSRIHNQLDGISALSLMASSNPKVKVIMVSSANNSDKLAFAKKIGASDYVIKNTRLAESTAKVLSDCFPEQIKTSS